MSSRTAIGEHANAVPGLLYAALRQLLTHWTNVEHLAPNAPWVMTTGLVHPTVSMPLLALSVNRDYTLVTYETHLIRTVTTHHPHDTHASQTGQLWVLCASHVVL